MSRPKKNTDEKSAYQKISDAFWELLEIEDYDRLTIKKITEKAKVNRNTIYYHFNNIDDMAIAFFKDEFSVSSLPNYALKIDEIVNKNKREMNRWMRISLFACKKSEFLESILRDELRNYWMESVNCNYDSLDFKNKVQIEFIISGTITVIAMARESKDPDVINKLADTKISRALLNLFNRHATKITN